MTTLRIPRMFLDEFKALVLLSEDQAVEISALIQSLEVGEDPEDVSKKLIDTGSPEAADIVNVLFSLLKLHNNSAVSKEDLIIDIVDAIRSEDIVIDDEDRLKNVLSTLLVKSTNLNLTFKASDLVSDFPAIFQNAKVLSDVRMIFNGEGIELDSCKYALLTHQLKVEYLKGGKREEVFASLTLDDLRDLKEIIERALAKDKMIQESNQDIKFVILK